MEISTTDRVAVVVADAGSSTADLDRAVAQAGFQVLHRRFGDLMATGEPDVPADLMLVSASLGLKQVAHLAQRQTTAGSPAFVVYPQHDLDALVACAESGFDYVMPPYLPALLQERVNSCQERTRLTSVVEQIADIVKLREYERDLAIAREIQSGFLPAELPSRDGWEFAAQFRPAREVAGDFYDGFELVNGRRLAFVVADVCDKGVGAALFMALIRTLLRHTAEHTGGWSVMEDMPIPEPGSYETSMLSVGVGPLLHAVTGTNRYLARNHQEQAYFATLFFGVLDPASGGLIYINGGHNPPVLLRRNSEQVLLAPTGPAVGLHDDSRYLLGRIYLAPGDSLLIYTDGVVDARDVDGRFYTTDRLRTVVDRPVRSARELIDNVDESLRAHVQGADQFDDITMIALRRADAED